MTRLPHRPTRLLAHQHQQELRSSPANQPAPLPDHNTWECDTSLRWWVDHLAHSATVNAVDRAWLQGIGTTVGSVALRASADRANRIDPELTAFNRYGERVDDITFDASWYSVLRRRAGVGRVWPAVARTSRRLPVARCGDGTIRPARHGCDVPNLDDDGGDCAAAAAQ